MSECYGHSEMGYDREEYCEIEALELDGPIIIVTELIDALLYDKGRASSDLYQCINDGTIQMLNRSVSYYDSYFINPLAWGIKTQIEISHMIYKPYQTEHYDVKIKWQTLSPDSSGTYQSIYSLDIYQSGKIGASIESPDIMNDGREERLMTPYDYKCLFDNLMELYEHQLIETSDS